MSAVDAAAHRRAALSVSNQLRSTSLARRLTSVATIAGVLGAAALAYWWTRAPLYNPAGSVDPWLYTSLFVNFDHIYAQFAGTYYASRLPWIVPGRIVFSVLPPDAAYWVLHGVAFVAGVVFLFVLVRRYLGITAAVVGAVTLALSPMYWNAQYWDYIDGATVTYLLGGLCFGLPSRDARRRSVSMALAGVFFAAAVTTNLFVVLVCMVYPILYACLLPPIGTRARILGALKDGAPLVAGGAALLLVLGTYAHRVGGQFLFFEPQLDLIRSPAVGASKLQGYGWLVSVPRLLVPIFLLLVAGPLLVFARRLPEFRFAAGAVGSLAFLTMTLYGWEFLAGGATLEAPHYFSYFSIPISLVIASLAALAVRLAGLSEVGRLVIALSATVAAVTALALIYAGDRAEWTGRPGTWTSLALMCGAAMAVAVFLGFRGRVLKAAAILAVGAIAFASHYAINASADTYDLSASAPDNRDLYHAGLGLVRLVNESTTRGDWVPAFWYRSSPDLMSIQSMYYFAYTYLGLELPRVTQEVRQRLEQLEPHRVVMLCDTRACAGGAAALRRAGYQFERQSSSLIAQGPVAVWVVTLRADRDGAA